jgi:hypothetical protein
MVAKRSIEVVIGRLATDQALRFEFRRRPASVLLRLADEGLNLTYYEVDALLALDMAALEQFVSTLDPSLEKSVMSQMQDPFGLARSA